jgi:hypothetical protein
MPAAGVDSSLQLSISAETILTESHFMYRRCILCTLYGAVDFLIVPSKGLYGLGGPEQGDKVPLCT